MHPIYVVHRLKSEIARGCHTKFSIFLKFLVVLKVASGYSTMYQSYTFAIFCYSIKCKALHTGKDIGWSFITESFLW